MDALNCEYPGCEVSDDTVHDYKRLDPEDLETDAEGPLSPEEQQEWRDEPIALCLTHAENRQRHI
jgi:hypothetical protein